MMRDGSSTALFVAGVALGAVAGVLLATRKRQPEVEAASLSQPKGRGAGTATADLIARMPKVRT